MGQGNNQEAFFALLRAGLWPELDKPALQESPMDWGEIYRLASEQSLLGLVFAGIDRLSVEQRPPKVMMLQWIGEVQLLEQRNQTLNHIIGVLVEKMRKEGIYTLLVKGQGVAQCYSKPMLRTSGDVDLLMTVEDFHRAISFLIPYASNKPKVERYSRHLALIIGQWFVELHGSLRTGLSSRLDREVDAVQEDTFKNKLFRIWYNREADVMLPSPNNDVFFVFTHFIKHFYKEGMNLRQVCDWCRLLWTYKNEIDYEILEGRLKHAGLLDEWKAFAALAVLYLDMPAEAMPLYNSSSKWRMKAEKILKFILNDGRPNALQGIITVMKIFPYNTLRFMPSILLNVNGLKITERVFSKA